MESRGRAKRGTCDSLALKNLIANFLWESPQLTKISMEQKISKFLTRNYTLLSICILLTFILLRLLPLRNNNFYFTMDQGNDAVHVRELLRGRFPLLGPETSVFGLFAGPLWFYLLAPGYFLSGGNPASAVISLVLLNTLFLFVVMKEIKSAISPAFGLFVGANLLFSWTVHDTARYAFNPFPMLLLGLLLILSLIKFFRSRELKHLLFSSIFVGLSFHADIASAAALTSFFLVVIIILVHKKRVRLKNLLYVLAIVVFFLAPHIFSELSSNFSQSRVFLRELDNPKGVFQSSNTRYISRRFIITISRSTFREIPELGIFLFCISLLIFFKNLRPSPSSVFARVFISLTLLLTLISWMFFISNSGWRDWHTSFLSPLIFISFLLLLPFLPKKLALLLYVISLYSHLHVFSSRYAENFRPTDDPSLFTNELSAIDWVYEHSGNQGFYVYNYLPSIYDYPYQYLFHWYGLKKYGFLPCEYAPYKNSSKLFYPPLARYSYPTKPCTNQVFLIIEPDERKTPRTDWISAISANSTLVDQATLGKIVVQKLLMKLPGLTPGVSSEAESLNCFISGRPRV